MPLIVGRPSRPHFQLSQPLFLHTGFQSRSYPCKAIDSLKQIHSTYDVTTFIADFSSERGTISTRRPWNLRVSRASGIQFRRHVRTYHVEFPTSEPKYFRVPRRQGSFYSLMDLFTRFVSSPVSGTLEFTISPEAGCDVELR